MTHEKLVLDHPLVRATPGCPCCGDEKASGALMCWPCWRNGGKEGAFRSLLDAAESWYGNREARARAAAIREARERVLAAAGEGPKIVTAEALAHLFTREWPAMVRAARAISAADAEDAAMDVLAQALARGLPGMLDPGPYLRRAAANRARDIRRARWRECPAPDAEAGWGPSPLADPERSAVARDRLGRCVAALTQGERRAVLSCGGSGAARQARYAARLKLRCLA